MKNLGLIRSELLITDYREDYPEIYAEEKTRLLEMYGNRISSIEHIGSTSIIGIKSKPVIDIVAITDNLEDFKNFTEAKIEGDTYTVKKEPTSGGDYLIRKEEDGRVKAFIHVYQTGDQNGITPVLFRDYLNSHPEARKAYEELKLSLLEKHADDRRKYTAEKDPFIKDIIAKALAEN